MLKFISEEKFVLKDRGTVFCMKSPYKFNRRELIGKKVIIDDKIYVVKGIESFGTWTNVDINDNIGLLVESNDN